jgi:hypothetical protein
MKMLVKSGEQMHDLDDNKSLFPNEVCCNMWFVLQATCRYVHIQIHIQNSVDA